MLYKPDVPLQLAGTEILMKEMMNDEVKPEHT